ncbi:MAG TPA: CDP-alcohol phosphatidyltransferase family protein [Bacteroidales bacterium]|nr:CDP-alcohol phosphatidyltransferase family protein [Bacteroidales bacterium]
MIKKHIPNILTICNMICGVIATLIAIVGLLPLTYAAIFVLIGALCDFLDGFTARLLHAYSEIGKQLDSFADLITFGFAPAAIVFASMQHAIFGGNISEISELINTAFLDKIYLTTPFLLLIFSAIRLAKFNIDTRQTHNFIGLPTPANALFFCGFIFIDITTISPVIILISILLFSYLLISEIPMFSLKMQSLSFKKAPAQFIFILFSVILIVFFKLRACSFIILIYIFISIIDWLLKKQKLT